MVGYANLLFPLYIYPLSGSWQPLLDAAVQYPDVTFTAVINPYSGPDSVNGCPNKDYVEAVHSLNQHSNIKTMGYVHTANRWNCGTTGTDICFCTAPAAEVKQNISTYAGWAAAGCSGWTTTTPDLRVDSIFIDEAPGQDGGLCLDYMANLTSFTKATLTTATAGQVLFNAGAATDLAYFDLADVIVIFEADQTAYEAIPDIGVRNGQGAFHRKSSIIIYGASNATALIQRDTDTVLSVDRDYFDSMFYTDRREDQYAHFPYDWAEIVSEVDVVAKKNKALLGA